MTSSNGELIPCTATCPAGKLVLGGGAVTTAASLSDANEMAMKSSGPTGNNAWFVELVKSGGAGGAITITAYAICATVAP